MTAQPPFDLDRIGVGLPFATAVPLLQDAMAGGVAVVQAPPGTGKTTLVPPAVANHVGALATSPGTGRRSDDRAPGRVVVVQPRRVAARAAAARLATLTGTPLGQRVGYTVRGERRCDATALVEVVTPGILLRRLLADAAIPGVAAVILDEVHERGLETDLLVGLLTDLRQLREDLVLVAMSATVDAAAFAGLLGGDEAAPVVDCPSALHPVAVTWRPAGGGAARTDARGVRREFLTHVAQVTAEAYASAVAAHPAVDALVFLPGAWEVGEVARRLREITRGTTVLELHGQVGPREQDRAVGGREPGDPPRIIVSTSLAESSLTVPGVRLVVDAGLAREPRRDTGRGMSGLVTVTCSRASADQRAGRAGRLGPGAVVRCYDEATYAAMPAHVTPQIATSDLTDALLTLACWGTPRGAGLRLPAPPPAVAVRAGEATLRELGAVDEAGQVTAQGRALSRIPVSARLARSLAVGSSLVGPQLAAEVVAAVSEDLRSPGADLTALLRELRSGDLGHQSGRWRAEARRLARLVPEVGPGVRAGQETGAAGTGRNGLGAAALGTAYGVGLVVALAGPHRVARRVGDTWLLASGTRAALPQGSSLQHEEWLAVADVARATGPATAGTGAVIRAAAPLDQDTAELAAAHLLVQEVRAELVGGRVRAREVRALGAIELSSTPVSAKAGGGRGAAPGPEAAAVHDAVRDAVRNAVQDKGIDVFTWSPAAAALRDRLALLHAHLGEPWPDVSDPALARRLDEWLGPEIDALARGLAADRVDLTEPLRRLLPWPEAARLDELAPERLTVASGSQVRISYPPYDEPTARPTVQVKLQECFGWAATPTVADGRVPITFHLLSPARRPVAITDDLRSFWDGPYQQVRAELRGRYPKHPWPEDPWSATATARTTRRR
ncbi:ATP-dependent helicase HrpB [Arsenicicoccus sp. oral taxon 190]|uniref:ATP-dependent helicase HrpB n=1 Tax=Arsenicicoccus sp. oral taxon 190 TaxID=1658671 RepID=UPI000679F13A|nr:ATP-dependent helicase HrpB [Arsenicicoccus sp. oral taxon 190]AKT50411.1 helicase [Arsenicicoccus sp. oral taxon 190]